MSDEPEALFRSKHGISSPRLEELTARLNLIRPYMHKCREATADYEQKPLYVVCQNAIRPWVQGFDRGDVHVKGMIDMQLDELKAAYKHPDVDPATGERESALTAMKWVMDKYPNEVTLEVLTHHKDDLVYVLEMDPEGEEAEFMTEWEAVLFMKLHPMAACRAVHEHLRAIRAMI